MSIVVAGGGIAGLATAHYLSKVPGIQKIVLMEASSRIGGWVQTTTMPDDGTLFEHGPRTIRPSGVAGANTLNIVEELGLGQKLKPIAKSHPTAKYRLIYANGALHELPSSWASFLRTQPPFKRPLAAALVSELLTPAKKCDDDSIYNFISRRLGEDFAQYLIDPMTRGICAGDAREISADAFVTGPVFRMEQESGGILKHLLKNAFKSAVDVNASLKEPLGALAKRSQEENWSVWSLQGGLEAFPTRWVKHLEHRGVEIRLNTPINHLQLRGAKSVQITLEGEETMVYDHAFMCTPAHVTANLVKTEDVALSSHLSSIPFVDVGVVNIEFDSQVSQREAFGFLVPSNQRDTRILGAIFDSCSFPQGDKSIFTVMMGGKWFNSLFGSHAKPDDLAAIAVEELRRIMGIAEEPSRVIPTIHRQAIPQYVLGHRQRVQDARQRLQALALPLSLVGSSYDGVGINDTILSEGQSGSLCNLLHLPTAALQKPAIHQVHVNPPSTPTSGGLDLSSMT
eukprot:snap_masked-scaffold277_size226016-processed-gene-0.8 protein:Tk10742 transcript:snap_masked-scaffold277_size226016-processed-gene-0.8-mRNA-1 annotation:"protoporphyrinogen oxidase"